MLQYDAKNVTSLTLQCEKSYFVSYVTYKHYNVDTGGLRQAAYNMSTIFYFKLHIT